MKRIPFLCTAVMTLLFFVSCNEASTSNEGDRTSPEVSSTDEASSQPEDEDIIIKMAIHTSLNQETSNAVREFNAADNGYRIEFVDYDEYDDENSYSQSGGLLPGGWAKADFELQMDILKGDTVHIVPDVAFSDQGKFDILMEKGAFIDLYPFLDADTEINRDTLDNHVLSLCEIDGRLCYLPTFYYIETMIGNKEYVGEKEGWTFVELKKCWDAMPSNATFNYSTTKYGVYWEILRGNLGAFIDYENATCSFDSPEFVGILELCNSFHTIYDKSEPDSRNPNFVSAAIIPGFKSYHNSIWSESGEEYTFVGYPTKEGNGAFLNTTEFRYAICADASPEVQKGAWAFIRMLANDEFACEMYNNNNRLVGFPVNCTAFNRLAQEEINRPKEEQSPRGNMTPDEYDRLCDYIKSIQKTNDNIDDNLKSIVNEEIDRLFHNQCSAQECADMIQSRASLYVSENAY